MTTATTSQPALGVAWLLSGHLHDDQPVRNIRVETSPFVVGRRDDASLTLACPTVSGRHAELTIRENQLYVRDLQSRNGTYVNGERSDGPFPVGPGDLDGGQAALGAQAQLGGGVADQHRKRAA